VDTVAYQMSSSETIRFLARDAMKIGIDPLSLFT